MYSEPEALIDEPDTLEGEPGWYNSTYFDEIYHARTAYEHLQGTRPYETTHPPLGKLLIGRKLDERLEMPSGEHGQIIEIAALPKEMIDWFNEEPVLGEE